MDNLKSEKKYGDVSVIQNNRHEWAVVDSDDNFIVPFGKYDWIDGFDGGLARVRTKGRSLYTKNIICIIDLDSSECVESPEDIQRKVLEEFQNDPESFRKWGIINEDGEEVLPLEYDEVWNFFKKGRKSTTVVKNGVSSIVDFRDLPRSIYYYDDEDDSDSGSSDDDDDYFSIGDCYDSEGFFDNDRLEDAIMDGEYVPGDW